MERHTVYCLSRTKSQQLTLCSKNLQKIHLAAQQSLVLAVSSMHRMKVLNASGCGANCNNGLLGVARLTGMQNLKSFVESERIIAVA